MYNGAGDLSSGTVRGEGNMAGSPIITCPECSKKFKGKGDLRGKKIRCPFCRNIFVVGEDESEESAPVKKSAAGTKKPAAAGKSGSGKPAGKSASTQAAPDDEFEDKDPYGVTDLDLAPRCPNCASEMESEEAVVCLHCGYNTLTRTWGKTEKLIATTGGQHFLYLLPGIICAIVILLQVTGTIFYCVVLPYQVKDSWMAFTDHESMRVWTTVGSLFDIWPLGYIAFNRLVLKPRPSDKAKQ